MRIGINLLYLLPDIVGGTETYAAGLIKGLANIDKQNEYYVFVNQSAANWPIPENENFIRIICPVEGPIRYRRYLFEQFRLPKLLSQYKIDLIHSLGYVCPLRSPCPSVVTIPDLNYIDVANTIGTFKRLILRFFSTQAAKRANHVITISNFSKERFCKVLHLPAEKITVTLLSTNKKNNIVPSVKPNGLLTHYGIEGPYIVAFGGGAIHKNIPKLIEAFSLLRNRIEHNLVLIGRIPANVKVDGDNINRELKGRIIITGYIPEKDIMPMLQNADIFVLPSLYEGFGLPVLEAQQAGVPVLCSNAGSIPEVGGSGALYFDPNSAENIAELILRCLNDKMLCSRLIKEGAENLRKYSWEKTAKETLQVYQSVLG